MEKRYATASHPLKTFFKMFSFLKYHPLLTALVIIIAFINVGVSLFGTSMLKPVIDDYIAPTIAGTMSFAQFKSSMIILSLSLLGIFILSFLLSVAQTVIMIKLSQLSVGKMRENLFKKIQDLPLVFFTKNSVGDLMSSFTNDLDLVNEAFSTSFLEILTSSTLVIGIMIMLFITNYILGLVILMMLPFMILLIKRFTKLAHKNFDATQKSLGEMNGYIEEIFSAQRVVKSFNKEDDVEKKFIKILKRMTDESIESSFYSNVGIPIVKNYSTLMLIVSTLLGCLLAFVYKISWLPLSTGTLAVFVTLVNQLYRPLNRTTNQLNIVQASLAGAERVFSIINKDEEHSSLDQFVLNFDGKCYYWENGNNKILVSGRVKFDGVNFSYDKDELVLKEITFEARSGEKVSLVGKTGSGKTTITNLLTKFYDVNDGLITIDGIDIKDIDYKSLRRMVALVLQNTNLFSGTIMENIRFGRLDATDEECIEAAKLAHCDDFISKLKDGYDTYISGGSSSLSSGQKQLLAIARVALSNAPILILDEATSSIDTRTEKLINLAMDKLMKGKTVIAIAHRLSTVKNSDCILVVDKGRIIEKGTHDELFKKRGKYYELCHKQEIDSVE